MRKKSAKIRKWQEEFASIDDRDLLDLSRYNDEKAKMSILMGNLPKEVISLIVLVRISSNHISYNARISQQFRTTFDCDVFPPHGINS